MGALVRRLRLAAVIVAAACLANAHRAAGASEWIEVTSAHFRAIADAGEGRTRTLLWQFEQIRSAVATMWPWARTDFARPLVILALRDENSMRQMAPVYWESGGDLHPASVWVTGADRTFVAVRTDLRGEDKSLLNPYMTAYFSYISLVLTSSVGADAPLWYVRGLAGVFSNTIVRERDLSIGAPIPSHLERIRRGPRFSIRELVDMRHGRPELANEERLAMFDAQAWALAHFLLFDEEGRRRAGLERATDLMRSGKSPNSVFQEAIGRPEDLEAPLNRYVNRPALSFAKADVDASVRREGFTARPLPSAEAASTRAAFHVAMRRPAEARALLAEARSADAADAGSGAVEAMLFETEGKKDEARAAYAAAVAHKSTNAYAYYRLAALSWTAGAGREALVEIERHLATATTLNANLAEAHALRGDVRAELDPQDEEALALARRAIALDPAASHYRLSAARILGRQGRLDEAQREVQGALALADTEGERERVRQVQAALEEAKARAAAPAASPANEPPREGAPDLGALSKQCGAGDAAACRSLLPFLEEACGRDDARACGLAGYLFADGRGIPKDLARAQELYERACEGQVWAACTNLAVILANGGRREDLPRARELLTRSCEGGVTRACELLKSLPQP